MSSGVHHPAVAKHDNVQRRVRSAALKHTLKGVFLSELMQICGLYGFNHDIKYNSKKNAVLIF